MKPVSCSRLQAKRFFAALCYTNQNIDLFERQLVELPERDWATVLLASIIIDNSGIAQARETLLRLVVHPKAEKASDEFWMEVPNQYILQNRAWLHPVIRACDPEKTTFTEDDYGARLLDNLSDKLSIRLRSQNGVVSVELTHSLAVMALLLSRPEITGASRYEVDTVLRAALTESVFLALRTQAMLNYGPGAAAALEDREELSRGLIFLVVMTLLFAATGLFFGYYCAADHALASLAEPS